MTQHDYNIANADGATVRGDLNNALVAGQELNSGATAPATTFAYQWWADTTDNVLKQRNAANNAWIIRGSLDAASVLAKSAAYTVVLADIHKIIETTATAGAYTVTLPAAASATDGFEVTVKNLAASTSAVTIDANAAETIDGALTVLVGPGQTRRIRSNGSNWRTIGGDRIEPMPGVYAKNLLINSKFQVWQRGFSFTAADYWADRFLGEIGGGATVTRETFALGQTDVPSAPGAFLRHTRTTVAGAANTVLEQRIERVDSRVGSIVTQRVYLKAGAAKTLHIDFLQHFGTGGSPSADVAVTSQSVAVTTSWQAFDLIFELLSVSGKTLGTDGNDYLAWRIREESSFSTFTLDVANPQVQAGAIATELMDIDDNETVKICLPYYERIVTNSNSAFNLAIGATQTSTVFEAVIHYHRKRAVPSISFVGNHQALIAATTRAISSPTVVSNTGPGVDRSNIQGTIPTDSPGRAGVWRAASDTSAAIIIDAEL